MSPEQLQQLARQVLEALRYDDLERRMALSLLLEAALRQPERCPAPTIPEMTMKEQQ